MEEKTNAPEQNVLSDYYTGYQELQLQAAELHVKKARNALFAVAAINLVVGLILYSASNILTGATVGILVLISAIFAGLGFLTKKQPFTAIIIGLVIYIGLWLLDIIVAGGEQIIRGILVRGIIIYFLVTGVKHAREAERLRRELGTNK